MLALIVVVLVIVLLLDVLGRESGPVLTPSAIRLLLVVVIIVVLLRLAGLV